MDPPGQCRVIQTLNIFDSSGGNFFSITIDQSRCLVSAVLVVVAGTAAKIEIFSELVVVIEGGKRAQ